MVGDCGQLLSRYAKRRARDANRGDWLALSIEDRNGYAAEAFLKLLVIDSVASSTRLFYLCTQSLCRANCAVREALEASATNDIGNALLRQKGQNGFAH